MLPPLNEQLCSAELDIGRAVSRRIVIWVPSAAWHIVTPSMAACCTGTWERSRGQRNQLVLRFPEALPTGRGWLSLQFQFALKPGLSGFYLASSKCACAQGSCTRVCPI